MDTTSIIGSDSCWVLVAGCLVMFMTPGLGYFYGGLVQHKNQLSLILLSMISMAVVSLQWLLFGFSLSFSDSSSSNFIGDFRYSMVYELTTARGVYSLAPTIPTAVFVFYECMFAAITPILALGAAAEKSKVFPCIIFIFFWTTLVYDFVAYWCWSANGWLSELGAIDFAGGTPVHVVSGFAALAIALMTGKRENPHETKPENVSFVVLGTSILWFGWFGFNGGSGFALNAQAANAVLVTHLTASIGGLFYLLIDYVRFRKTPAVSFCAGAVIGLVAITPASGYVELWTSLLFGTIPVAVSYVFLAYKHHYLFDDALDVFGVHGIGGVIGSIMTGIFASKDIMNMYSTTPKLGGWINGNFKQVGFQLAEASVGALWSFSITIILIYLMNSIGLRIRANVENAKEGLDKKHLGENIFDRTDTKSFNNFELEERPTATVSKTIQDEEEQN